MIISECIAAHHTPLPLTTLIQSKATSFYSLKINLNIPPSTPWSSKWSVSFRFPNQNRVSISRSPHSLYMSGPFQAPSFDQPINIRCYVRTTVLLIMQFLPASCNEVFSYQPTLSHSQLLFVP